MPTTFAPRTASPRRVRRAATDIDAHRVNGSSVPLRPVPWVYFDPDVADQKITEDTKLAVDTADMPGHVYGLLAPWGRCILDAQPGCWTVDELRAADPNLTNVNPHQGDTLVDFGNGRVEKLRTANMGGDRGHAKDNEWTQTSTIQSFYENTSTQLARVRYFWGREGLCFTGVAWPDAYEDPRTLAKMEASATSLHARPIEDLGGVLGFVGACLVNGPGLPLRRAASIKLDTSDGIFTWYDGATFHAYTASAFTPQLEGAPMTDTRSAALEIAPIPLAEYTDPDARKWYCVLYNLVDATGTPCVGVVANPDEDYGQPVTVLPAANLTATGMRAVITPDEPDMFDIAEIDSDPPYAEAATASAAVPHATCGAVCTCKTAATDPPLHEVEIGLVGVDGAPVGTVARVLLPEGTDALTLADLLEGVTVALTEGNVSGDDISNLEAVLDGMAMVETHDDLSTAELPNGRYQLVIRNAEDVAPNDLIETVTAAYTQDQRDTWAKEGIAMKDGGYPIPDVGALHDAIASYGRASDPEAVKAHIIDRAEALDAVDELPESWNVTGAAAIDAQFAALAAADIDMRLAALAVADTRFMDRRASELAAADIDRQLSKLRHPSDPAAIDAQLAALAGDSSHRGSSMNWGPDSYIEDTTKRKRRRRKR